MSDRLYAFGRHGTNITAGRQVAPVVRGLVRLPEPVEKDAPRRDRAWRKIQAYADKLAPELKAAFLAAVAVIRGRTAIRDLARLMETGNTEAVMRAIGIKADDFARLATAAGNGFIGGGTVAAAATEFPGGASLEGRFDMLNPRSVEFLRRYRFMLAGQISAETEQAVRDVVIRAFQEGGHPYKQAREIRNLIGLTRGGARATRNYRAALEAEERAADQIERMVERYRRRQLLLRGETIARTESIRAASAGQQELWHQAADLQLFNRLETKRRWVLTPDDRLCALCAAIPGANPDGRALDEPFQTGNGPIMHPPVHPSCFPGDASVSAKGISAGSQRWYDGDLVVIRMASGKDLSCTPNHPILTPAGWVAAGLLNEGGYVIGGRLGDRMPHPLDLDDQNVPARIQDVVEALGRSKQMAARPMPIAAEDFHGDGIGSEVAVIFADRALMDQGYATRREHFGEPDLVTADMQSSPLNGLGAEDHLSFGRGTPTRGFMSAGNLPSSLVCRHARPFQRLGFAPPSKLGAMAGKGAREGLPADIENGRQLVDRLAGGVAPDKIVGVARVPFRGHVYNLETKDGWYVVNGILVHNCRCAMGLDFGGTFDADARVVGEAAAASRAEAAATT